MGVLCVLPARLSSRRIPRKPLQRLAGKPLVEWAWLAASRVEAFDEVVVASDSEEVVACVRGFGGEAVLTDPGHRSGSDRVAEAASLLGARGDDIVVNFQADEPFVDGESVGRAVRAAFGAEVIATVAAPIRSEEEWRSPGVVKVVAGPSGHALYFSRAPIPHSRDEAPAFDGPDSPFLRHVGVYASTGSALERWTTAPESRLERIEKLEQLRALEIGMRVQIEVGPATEPGVDLPEDLERAARLLAEKTEGGMPPRGR